MKKLLAAAAGIVALGMTGSAFAADLPPPLPFKAPLPPPWYDWTGFYVGANGGYSWGRAWNSITAPGVAAFSGTQNLNGGLGGGQIGYNWQFNRNWVVGLEADIQGTGERGNAGLPTIVTVPGVAVAALPAITTTGTFSQKLPWFGTVRGRVGVEPADRVLLYVTGGFAYGEVDSNSSITASAAFPPAAPFAAVTANASAKNTQPGWTVGAGGEWAFISRWSVKVEYLYVDLSAFTNTFTGTGPAFPTITARTHFTDNIFRVGINYNFGGPHY
jgi:outer membrane immunogenic protein